MHARVSTFEGSPEALREAEEAFRTELVPQVIEIDGCRGVITLVDYNAGKEVAVTLWEGEEAMQASVERANQIRSEAAEVSKAQILSVDQYEVSVFDVRG